MQRLLCITWIATVFLSLVEGPVLNWFLLVPAAPYLASLDFRFLAVFPLSRVVFSVPGSSSNSLALLMMVIWLESLRNPTERSSCRRTRSVLLLMFTQTPMCVSTVYLVLSKVLQKPSTRSVLCMSISLVLTECGLDDWWLSKSFNCIISFWPLHRCILISAYSHFPELFKHKIKTQAKHLGGIRTHNLYNARLGCLTTRP